MLCLIVSLVIPLLIFGVSRMHMLTLPSKEQELHLNYANLPELVNRLSLLIALRAVTHIHIKMTTSQWTEDLAFFFLVDLP